MTQHSVGAATSYAPISCYVLKIASRCNLNCTYCHMYNLADKSYRAQPALMSQETVDATLSKIKDHALRHNLTSVSIIFHGGEPLLAGQEFFRSFVAAANKQLQPEITPIFTMQTNGTMLSVDWLETIAELGIGFGVSLDGPPAVNDKNRVDHQGRGSYAQISAGFEAIQTNAKFRKLSKLVLCVIDPDSDPMEIYRHFRSLPVMGVDFRFPDGTYDEPPAGWSPDTEETRYADWLIPIFNEWFDTQDKDFRIRLFDNIIGMIVGSDFTTNNIGGRSIDLIVVETDGGIEPIPSLKACGDSFTKVGLNVKDNSIDDVYEIPLFRVGLEGIESLGDTCKRCPIVSVCGGGHLPHRYSAENGFANPSLFCKDLMKLITHIQERVVRAIPEELRQKMRLATLSDLKQNQAKRSAKADAIMVDAV